jgi:putative restriction endonuclease
LQLLLGESEEEELATVPVKKLQKHQSAIKLPVSEPSGPTEKVVTVKARLGQRFFRQSVLASYNRCCCITGNPVPELLVASHILPWGKYPEQRLNPHNGLCLTKTQDAAFDKGLITLDEDYRLVSSPYLREFLPNDSLTRNFLDYEGKQIVMPEKFPPDVEFMQLHREEVFQHS